MAWLYESNMDSSMPCNKCNATPYPEQGGDSGGPIPGFPGRLCPNFPDPGRNCKEFPDPGRQLDKFPVPVTFQFLGSRKIF